MQPGGYHPRANTVPSGAWFRNGNSSNNNAPPYRPPQEQMMTPRQREEVLLAAGRLAAEYLVSKGELPQQVLHNRPAPPAPRPFQERPVVPRPQHNNQASPRPFQEEERPLAKQHFQPLPPPFQRPFAPRPFQQHRPIAKRPRPFFQGRPPAFHPRAPAAGRPYRPFQQGRPPFTSGARSGPATGHPAQGAAPAGSVTQRQGDGNDAPAGYGSNVQPVPQSDGTAQSPQMINKPNQN